MIGDILYFGIYNIISFGLLVYYLDALFERRKIKFFYGWVGAATILFFAINILFKNPDYNFIGTLILHFLIAYLLYKGGYFRKTVFILLFITIGVYAEGITFLGNNVLELDHSKYLYLWGGLSQLIFFMVIYYLKRVFKEIRTYDDRKLNVVILSITICSLIYIIMINVFLTNYEAKLIALIAGIIVFFVLIFLYKYLESQSRNRKLSKEKEELERNMEINTQYYSMVDNYQQEVRRLKHDMKNQLMALYQMDENRKTEFLKEKITDLEKVGKSIYSVHPLINFILHQKLDDFEIKKEKRRIQSNIPQEIPMSSGDLGILIGNLMDNIIEALEKLPLEDRFLDVQFKKEGLFFVVEAVNTCIKGANPRFTTKSDELNHGYGIKSIELISEKYKGRYTYEIKGGIFTSWIEIPIYTEI